MISKISVEFVAMVLVKILRDQGQDFRLRRKMLGNRCVGTRARGADMEVGNVPILDQATDCARRLKSLKLAEALDRQNVGRLQPLVLGRSAPPLANSASLLIAEPAPS